MPSVLDSQSTDDRLKHGKRLTEGQKRAIVAAVATKGSITLVAQEFGVHRNTVQQLVRSVREAIPDSDLSTNWRQKLTDRLPSLSVDAIEQSVIDRGDVHKAASTAIAHLKGIGVLAADSNSTINVFVSQVVNLPSDWQREYLSVESTPSEPPE